MRNHESVPSGFPVFDTNYSDPKENWRMLASCRFMDPDIFYSVRRGNPKRLEEAKATAICANCLVRLICLDFAVKHNEEFGVWGGMGEKERDKYRHSLMEGNLNQGDSPVEPHTDIPPVAIETIAEVI